MDQKPLQFLASILGEHGAEALRKAAVRSPELEAALLPRSILSWLNFVMRFGHDGELPGVPDTYLTFSKSEGGFSGRVGVGDEIYAFQDATLYHLAAAVAVALGVDPQPVSQRLRTGDMERLGRNIDLLAKARAVADKMAKLEGPGQPAKPRQPVVQAGPTLAQPAPGAQTARKPSLPRRPRSPMLKVALSDTHRKCSTCDRPLFEQGKFKGCACFRSMSKSVSTRAVGDSVVLEFGTEWDAMAILSLRDTIYGT